MSLFKQIRIKMRSIKRMSDYKRRMKAESKYKVNLKYTYFPIPWKVSQYKED